MFFFYYDSLINMKGLILLDVIHFKVKFNFFFLLSVNRYFSDSRVPTGISCERNIVYLSCQCENWLNIFV